MKINAEVKSSIGSTVQLRVSADDFSRTAIIEVHESIVSAQFVRTFNHVDLPAGLVEKEERRLGFAVSRYVEPAKLTSGWLLTANDGSTTHFDERPAEFEIAEALGLEFDHELYVDDSGLTRDVIDEDDNVIATLKML